MILKILGVGDLIIAAIFILSYLWHIIPDTWLFVMAGYLALKGLIFLISLDLASMVDIGCALVMFISAFFNIPFLVGGVVALFLIQKGVLSLLD